MRLRGVEVRRVALPLRRPFRSATGVEHERDVVIVRVETNDGHEGWGECGALATPHYTAEYTEGAAAVIERFLAPALLAGGAAQIKGHPMAKAALEMAVLDAELRTTGQPLSAYLGGTRTRVPAGVALGFNDDLADYVDQGYRRIKVKIAPGHDLDVVRAARAAAGPDIALWVDANGTYTPADRDHLLRLDEFDLGLIEQPFAADDLAAHSALASRLRTPICLDESISSARTATDALDQGACSVVNVKPARVGGLREARRIHDLCLARDVAVWCGGMLETGLGRAANVALASLPGFTLPGDLSASDRYFATDLTPPFVLDDGHLAVPTGPGLGVSPLPDVLAAVTTSSRWLRS